MAARERLLAASTDAPNDPLPHVYLSRLAREANDLATASQEAVKAVRLGENNATALRELATTLFAMRNFTGARAFYARAITVDPADHLSQGYLDVRLSGELPCNWYALAPLTSNGPGNFMPGPLEHLRPSTTGSRIRNR